MGGRHAIAAINTLTSHPITREFLTEDNLRRVMEYAEPASVADSIIHGCDTIGVNFVTQYVPIILKLEETEIQPLDRIVDSLKDKNLLTAEAIDTLFECRIESKETNSVLKIDYLFKPLCDCLEHLHRGELEIAEEIKKIKEAKAKEAKETEGSKEVKETEEAKVDKQIQLDLIDLPTLNQLVACFKTCPDLKTADKFAGFFTRISPNYLAGNFEKFAEACVTGKGNAAENAQVYIDETLQKQNRLKERKSKIGREIEQRIKEEVFKLFDELEKIGKISPHDLELRMPNLLNEGGALRKALEQTQAVVTGEIWKQNKDVYDLDECSAVVNVFYVSLWDRVNTLAFRRTL